MNILILTHSYPCTIESYGGIFVKEQAKALSSDHQVFVVCFNVNYENLSPFSSGQFIKRQHGNLTEYFFKTGRSFPIINQYKYLKDTYWFIRNTILRDNKIDIIHCHVSYPSGILGVIISKAKKIPCILTEHTAIKKLYRSIIHKLCVNYALKKASALICVSNSLRKEVRLVVNRRVFVVPNIVNTNKITSAEHPDSEVVNIGFLGNLNSRNKGLDILLMAMSKLNNRKYKLHIGGNGILLQDFQKMSEELGIKDDCIFYGNIIPAKLGDFLSGLSFFVLPSRYETFGIVLIEAMAAGLPVISTKCGGPEDFVTAETGILIPPGDVNGLENAIIEMEAKIKSYKREKIRAYAINTFGEKAFIERINPIYQSLHQTQAPSPSLLSK
ncbi:MAG TPA: glycosyltransferase [Bacteroidales bacterium]|nr:glycosyltransferase [Bacteroidales bacterium]